MENLLNCHGKRFKCKIKGIKAEGKISVDDRLAYLCQNEYKGAICEDKQGYNYSWIVDEGNILDLEYNDVTDFQLLDEEEKERTYTEEDMLMAFCAGANNENEVECGPCFEIWIKDYNKEEK
jgi:hypothetical protein